MKRELHALLVLIALAITSAPLTAHAHVCGDVNNDPQEKVNIMDVIYLVSYLFGGGPAIPDPIARANVDCSANPNPNIDDVVFLLNAIFGRGEIPCASCPEHAFQVRIEKTHNTPQGGHEFVDVMMEHGAVHLGGFELNISYDPQALSLVNVSNASSALFASGCEWEYFAYRVNDTTDCGFACAIVKVVAVADVNTCCHYPLCLIPNEYPANLFTLEFQVTDDPLYECQFIPLNFVWLECGENAFANRIGNVLYESRDIYDFASGQNIADSTTGYPTTTGAQSCSPGAGGLVRFIDFYNGGIDITCVDTIESRGDVNLNQIAYEIADYVLFGEYFAHGLSVFSINQQQQIATTDINADGVTLGVADLIYMLRVLVGLGSPLPAPPSPALPPPIEATFTVSDGQISIDSAVAAAFVIVEGDVEPALMLDPLIFAYDYAFDGAQTRILIRPTLEVDAFDSVPTFNGAFLAVGSNEVISAEFGTAEGGVVNATRVDE